jgi:hypothetical protein
VRGRGLSTVWVYVRGPNQSNRVMRYDECVESKMSEGQIGWGSRKRLPSLPRRPRHAGQIVPRSEWLRHTHWRSQNGRKGKNKTDRMAGLSVGRRADPPPWPAKSWQPWHNNIEWIRRKKRTIAGVRCGAKVKMIWALFLSRLRHRGLLCTNGSTAPRGTKHEGGIEP